MRPESAEIDSTRVLSSVSGTATTTAKVMPAVAMATVRQVSRATIAQNSASHAKGQKLAMNCALILTLSGSSSTQGLNSVATPSGHSSTKLRLIQNTRPSQAGSRVGAALFPRVGAFMGALAAVHHHRHRLAGITWLWCCGQVATQLMLKLRIELCQVLGGDLGCGQVKGQCAIAQANDAREVGQRHINLVQRSHQRDAPLLRACNQRTNRLGSARGVQCRQGFVNEPNLRWRHERPRQTHALTFTA